MDKKAIKKYAIWARNELIARVTQKAEQYEITEQNITPADADSIGGRVLTATEKKQRQALISKINHDGFGRVMEEVAYTWFNRLTALRFMEVNNYLPSHTRVFTNDAGEYKPQILADAIQLEFDGLDMNKVFELKDENKTEELYKYLLITQCNALSSILPRMFQKIEDYTELLLPDYLLREGSVIEQMISMIPEENFDVKTEGGQIEIIGWLYQFYISEKHEEVVDPLHGKVVKKGEVPAATQLFTTDWVVRYLIDNSVGRYWIERNPDSQLTQTLDYYVNPKEYDLERNDEKIVPQDVTVFDPCVGSGHFLVYAFDVLMKIYREFGYTDRDAASEIVKNNLFGLDIDGRAAQLAYFSVMMKARQYDRRFFSRNIQPNIYEIMESNSVDTLSIEHFCVNESIRKDVEGILTVLDDAKEYGSLLEIPTVDFGQINKRFEEISNDISIYSSYLLNDLMLIIRPAEVMSRKYAVVATNPPYLNKYDAKLKKYLHDNYKDFWNDLFSVFIYRNGLYCKSEGYTGFMTPFVWMFISSYEKLRRYILDKKEITTLIQFEYSAFSDATVPICSFVLCNHKRKSMGDYIRLSDYTGGMDIQKKYFLDGIKNIRECEYVYSANQEDFLAIPGSPIAYWANKNIFRDFQIGKPVGEIADVKRGMTTSDNKRFLRFWPEVSWNKVKIDAHDKEEALQSKAKWFPYSKGGGYRKWYGYQEFLIDWENDGENVIGFAKTINKSYTRTIVNISYYFRPSVGFCYITSGPFSMRWIPEGFLYDSGGPGMFADEKTRIKLIACMNSKPAQVILKMLSPTINLQIADVVRMPFIFDEKRFEEIKMLVLQNIKISKDDWDSFETSWNFATHPFLESGRCFYQNGDIKTIKQSFAVWKEVSNERFNRLKENEEALNSIFIQTYGLEDDLTADVDIKDVTVYRADLQNDIRSFISYAVGCIFGRYSIDSPGLAYAGGAWDDSKYVLFKPDKDAILPICDDEYFDDDIVGRFVKFVEVVYGSETLEENLKFVADSLGGKGTSREVIRSYFMNDFYADHLKVYQKRPIYWLFDSGKKNGFKCLVYMHRYKLDTIARIRTDYVHEQQSRYRTAIDDYNQRISNASSSDRVKLNKRLQVLQAQAIEIREYEERIHHLADQMISIDLDDGVKYNYEIFKDVLAKIK